MLAQRQISSIRSGGGKIFKLSLCTELVLSLGLFFWASSQLNFLEEIPFRILLLETRMYHPSPLGPVVRDRPEGCPDADQGGRPRQELPAEDPDPVRRPGRPTLPGRLCQPADQEGDWLDLDQ